MSGDSCDVKTATGSPLNLALIGHWDGWQPFKTGTKSCGSIEISIANMCKEDPAHVDDVFVVGFVPYTCVPNDVPEACDPFLEPLMHDLCEVLLITSIAYKITQLYRSTLCIKNSS